MSRAINHMPRVKELPCCLCGASAPSEAHHILEGRIKGKKHMIFALFLYAWTAIKGAKNGIHGQQYMLKVMKQNELNLLGETIEKLYG